MAVGAAWDSGPQGRGPCGRRPRGRLLYHLRPPAPWRPAVILILEPDTDRNSPAYEALLAQLDALPNIEHRAHTVQGAQQTLTEIYLLGNTQALSTRDMAELPLVERVVRISEAYKVLGRHTHDDRAAEFSYRGVRFAQDNLNVFAGLCAVDSPESVEAMMAALKVRGQVCTRMGAYKPRTSPYSFQGRQFAPWPWKE